jgi:uncharacterized protein
MRIVWWGGLFGWFVILAVVIGVVALATDESALWALLPLIALILGAYGAVMIPRRYEAWQYRFGADALEMQRGVWWRSAASVPYHRIQHVDIDQGPIQRQLGMVSLGLKTASASSVGGLPGIDAEEADALRAWLVARAERSDGA